jgi:hypothetical protein
MSKRKKSNRKIHTRDLIERILIVCEGKKTEPNYFRKFPIDKSKYHVESRGEGRNTKSLVERAIEIQEIASPPFNKIWCVFDKDDNSDQIFNEAMQIARANKIEVAYSNEAFELWYLLHFNYYDSAMKRHQYQDKLTELIGHEYVKNSENMYQELEDKQPDAIRNAKRLLSSYSPPNPAKDNPSTTIHQLVEELNKRLKIPLPPFSKGGINSPL